MTSSTRELKKNYDPKPIEDKWYEWWLQRGLFNAKVDESKEAFSIVIPPPNVTGSLHMGHAFNNTFQDVICRFKRMRGYSVLWLPGTDHAGIATQNVVERELAKKGITRHDMSRDEFVEKVWSWKEDYGSRIVNQMKKLGNSCDWNRERFTMDEGLSRAVRTVFVRLYKKGLIYRGKYIINWCPRCHTALSDLEVEHSEEPGKLYYVRYPFVDGEGEIIVATTRPETIMGDAAIAIHPRDDEHKSLVGRKVVVPLTNGRQIPIIEDNMVDPEFGTGFVKITPAHDPNDFLVGQRHDLEQIQVIDAEGYMNENAFAYKGLSVAKARVKSAAKLEELGLLEKIEDLPHQVGHCYRCGTVVEPYLSEQWFVKAGPLAEMGVKAVKEGKIRWLPEHWEKTYFQWMDNIRDWCISRQLWWGHRIPAWTCEECGHVTVAEKDPACCEKCGSNMIRQDEDVLDTWFSSALWPFSTLGWPDSTEELKYYYPTSLMVTGFDIIFFWVSRMIMMGLEFMDEEPFKDVYIHALVRDENGQKMSKSKGNVIDPLLMIDKYGADALRFTVAALTMPGRDILLSPAKIETYRFFLNKLWNASRFVQMNLEGAPLVTEVPQDDLRMHDRWILTRTAQVIDEVTKFIDGYFVGDAARMLYDFIWGDFCDWYIEMAKPALRGDEGETRKTCTQIVLRKVFGDILKLLHPFVPFVTEELWHVFDFSEDSIEEHEWPTADTDVLDEKALRKMEILQDVVKKIRNLRVEAHLAPQKRIPQIVIQTDDNLLNESIDVNSDLISLLTRVDRVVLIPGSTPKPSKSLSAVADRGQIFLGVGDLLDVEAEIQRLRDELSQVKKNLEKSLKKLGNSNFIKRAPAEVVEKEKGRLAESKIRIARIIENIESLERF